MSPVKLIKECFVRPKSDVDDSERYHYLSPLAFNLLSVRNTQYGLLFSTSSYKSKNFFDNLKLSLSHALVHFYPLAGRLVTKTYDEQHSCFIFVDCKSGLGARLIHASSVDVSVDNMVNTSTYCVPLVIQSFFDLGERQANHDGQTRALFIGCCINHCVVDGTSFSHFLNMLSTTSVFFLCATFAILVRSLLCATFFFHFILGKQKPFKLLYYPSLKIITFLLLPLITHNPHL
ncbi:protein ENHANCED PSEUDOMONAS SUSCEPTIBILTY 1-like [Chenopodium quinoa]|uniref:protein ENHANCED PSEUDOMONAS SUSCEPTIBILTY 1-like n=1 Tax=Chenopodium quinoa TaxID=63459 RepID=UPI000B786290|nr:protein ENHANCED PSEUDOMONAS SUSCEPTIBILTY 1-like [Chenopodium quinoa]